MLIQLHAQLSVVFIFIHICLVFYCRLSMHVYTKGYWRHLAQSWESHAWYNLHSEPSISLSLFSGSGTSPAEVESRWDVVASWIWFQTSGKSHFSHLATCQGLLGGRKHNEKVVGFIHAWFSSLPPKTLVFTPTTICLSWPGVLVWFFFLLLLVTFSGNLSCDKILIQ